MTSHPNRATSSGASHDPKPGDTVTAHGFTFTADIHRLNDGGFFGAPMWKSPKAETIWTRQENRFGDKGFTVVHPATQKPQWFFQFELAASSALQWRAEAVAAARKLIAAYDAA